MDSVRMLKTLLWAAQHVAEALAGNIRQQENHVGSIQSPTPSIMTVLRHHV